MRLTRLLSSIVVLYAMTALNAWAQNVTVNPGAGSYPTLKAAFDAINAGTHTGAITVSIVGNTDETTTSAVLNASGSGAASYSSILITPVGARTITGATTAGSPLIDLSGADNVTIDGLNASGNSLTIANTTVSATSGTATIRFIGGATNNTITNANIQGSGTMSVATNGAVIFFSTDAVTTSGNDNNTISNNNIGPAGSNLPTKAILGNGSTSTTAIGNSGNVITNNNIFDYFGAAVTSSGVATNGGCNAWTITNNRFYQTGTRTWTTGAIHRAIDINNNTATSGAQGFTITGNIIGYSSPTQTGTYTLTGSTGRFQAIQYNGITGGALTTISNNTVAAVSLTGVTSSGTSTSTPMIGILATNGLVTTNANTIGSQSATGSLLYSTNTTTATDVYGIYNFTVDNWIANDNTIGGITANNAGASGAFILYGMRGNTGAAVTWSAQNNIIGGTVANSLQNNSTSTTAQTIGLINSLSLATLRGNTIRNLTSAGGTGTSTGASVIGMSFASTSVNNTVEQNTISALANTNSSAATTVAGIQYTASTGTNILQRNLIHSLNAASATAIVNGINISGGTNILRNNMIRLGQDAAGNDITVGAAFSGINEFLGTNTVFNNSILITGSGVGGTANTFAFNGQQTTNTRSFQNNNFVNARSNGAGTGKHYGIRVGGTTPNPTGLTSNYNNVFVSGTGGVFGLFNALDVANLAAWQAATGQDAQSISSNPLYVSNTDLHLTSGSPSRNVGLVIASVTNDFDGDSRPGTNLLYDIGADEFDGIAPVANDLQATAFIDPANGGSKLAGASFSPQASFTNNGINAQSGVTVRYRIVNAGATEVYNQTAVIASIASGVTTTVTFPATTLSAGPYTMFARSELGTDTVPGNDQISGAFTVEPPLAGTYTVGSGGNFASLTNTGGAFQALNNLGASANITLNVISDLTGETGAVALNELAGGFSVRIQPVGAPRTITGSSAAALITLNGADNVTLEGSLTGGTAANVVGGDPSLRNLSITNTNTGTAAAVIHVGSGTAGAQNVTLRNLNLSGQDPTTTLIGVSIGGATPGTTGADNDAARVENCSVQKAIFGIYSAGTSAANPNLANVITKNDLTGTSGNRIRRVGILVFNQDGVEISLNAVGGIDSNESADSIGIGVGTQGIDATTVAAGGVVNAVVTRNRIQSVVSASATGFSAAGITVAGGTGSNLIANNMISGVIGPSTSPDLTSGIFVAGTTGSTTRLLANSISLSGDRGAVASQMPSFGIAVTGTDPIIELKDNAIANTQIASGGGASAKSYAIGLVTTTFANLDANYNLYYATSSNPGFFRTGSLSTAAGTDYATLAAWQAAVADDANSLYGDPLYVSASDLHLQAGSPALNAGLTLAAVTVDIDGDARANPPEIGADEVPPPNTAPTISATPVTRRAGDAGANTTIANVNDLEDAENTLAVTVNGAASATVNGVTVSGLSTSAAGVTTADVVATCNATNASFTLRVTDSGALFNEATLAVTVDPNLPPTLSYPAVNAVFGENLSVNPATGPSDSGGVALVTVQSAGTYTGGLGVNSGGVVSLGSAAPVGSHTIVIRAVDNCDVPTDANLALTVAKADTATTILTDTPDPSVVKTPVLVTYSVVAVAPGAGTPSGTVTVSDGVNNCSASVAAGQCSLTLSTLGARTLTATYTGDSNFNGSSDTEAHQVDPPANTAPTISAVPVTRRAGDASANGAIASVNDAEDAENTLAVTVNGAASATVNGVTVSGISTSVAGVTTANVVAACGATGASFTLRVTDSGTLFNEATLAVTVDPNLPPTLSYAATNAVFGQSLTVNPATGPSDSGSVSSVALQSAGTYTGTVSVNSAGVVSLGNAAPVGGHTIVIRATDNCAASTDANLALNVGQAATTTTITSDTPDPSFAGQPFVVQYTVVANAPGAGTPAGNVTVSDGVDSCTATVAAGQCNLSLSTPGNRTLTATYAGNSNFASSSGTTAHTVSPTADLAIVKTASDTLIGSGVIQYTLTVSNPGPSTVTGATVSDNFPAEVTGATWTCSGTGGGTCTASGSGNISQQANLPAGASVIYAITANIALPLPVSTSNTATVSVPVGITDPIAGNNSSTAVTVIRFFADGFEGGASAPLAQKLALAAPGVYASLPLPLEDVRALALGHEAIEVIRFQVADSLVVVQTRRLGTEVQTRTLQVNSDRSFVVGPWLALDTATALRFVWAVDDQGRPGAAVQAE